MMSASGAFVVLMAFSLIGTLVAFALVLRLVPWSVSRFALIGYLAGAPLWSVGAGLGELTGAAEQAVVWTTPADSLVGM